jgi:limonene-1,2-epoxide hydrolase
MASSEGDIVRAFIAAINRRDVDEIGKLMAEDHQFIDSAGRAVSGRVRMTAGWRAYFAMFPDFEIQIESVMADAERVAVFGRTCGTYNGKRGLVVENRIEMPAAWRAVVSNGEIKVWQVYADWTEGLKRIDEDNRSG